MYAARMSSLRRLAFFAPAVLAALSGVAATASAADNTPGQEATNRLFLLVLLFAVGIGSFVLVLLVAVVFKFRKRKGHTAPVGNPKTHDNTLETLWTVIPAVILLFVGIATFQTLAVTDVVPENPDVTVTVIGHQWYWEFQTLYPNGTWVNTTGELTVEVGQTVKLIIESADVVHAFYIPEFGLKKDAFPGTPNVYWFQARNAGDFVIQCAEYCGISHYVMVGSLHVVPG